jgi:hypothetical protein
MANSDRPRGFVPVAHMSGGQIKPRAYSMDDAASIYKGDLVITSIMGRVKLGAAAAANTAIGIAAETITGGDDDKILVWDDPNIIYEVQGYTGVTFTEGMVLENADHVANSPDTTYNISRQELDTGGSGTKGQFLILGKAEKPGNEWGEHVKLLVVFNTHFTKAAHITS